MDDLSYQRLCADLRREWRWQVDAAKRHRRIAAVVARPTKVVLVGFGAPSSLRAAADEHLRLAAHTLSAFVALKAVERFRLESEEVSG